MVKPIKDKVYWKTWREARRGVYWEVREGVERGVQRRVERGVYWEVYWRVKEQLGG